VIPRPTSVAVLVVTLLVIAVTLVLGILGTINYRTEAVSERAGLEARTRALAERLAAALTLPLWNFDRAQVDKVVESVMTDREVYGVVVRQHDLSAPGGVTLYALVRDGAWNVTPAAREFPSTGLLTGERPIAAGDDTLGVVRVFVSARFVERELRSGLWAIALRIVLVDLILVVSLFLLLWWIVLKPLQAVEQYALAVSSGHPPDPEVRQRRFRGELEGLRASIERTFDLLDARYTALRDHQQALAESESRIRGINAELEQRVRDRTARLEAANRELEAFSYSVSHDLRAPLRAIAGFSRIVLEDHGQDLPAESTRLLRIIDDNTRQMGHLIDDLLEFSRLSRQSVTVQTVEPGPLVNEIVEEMRAAEPARRVEVTIEDLPACEADPSLLRQVFVNLLSNAFKYTRRRDPATVHIGSLAGKDPGERTFFVRDNGTGFDMRYADKLFGVFQRLHRVEDYEGTGVGLAIVQRIILGHGGRVWAEAEVDRGATFYFTLPGGEHVGG
jgi:signal transduction histidine kinase